MKTRTFIAVLILSVMTVANSGAQMKTMDLWPSGIPGIIFNDSYVEKSTTSEGVITRFEKTTNPMLYVYLPPRDKATGTAVLICPGGGYAMLAFGHEGNAIASWLNDNGIAGIILKYRLPSDLIMKDKTVGPLQDAQEGRIQQGDRGLTRDQDLGEHGRVFQG